MDCAAFPSHNIGGFRLMVDVDETRSNRSADARYACVAKPVAADESARRVFMRMTTAVFRFHVASGAVRSREAVCRRNPALATEAVTT